MHDPASNVTPEVQSAIRTLALDRITAQVVTAFRDEGIRTILLKGPALARWLYRSDEWRGYADCDLLVAPDDVRAAERILERSGFKREGLQSIAEDWENYSSAWTDARASNIDLHHTMVGIGVPAQEFWRIMAEGTEQIQVGGVDVEILRPAARLVGLVMHVAKDGSRREKARHDLAHAAQRLPIELWREAVDLADRLEAGPAFVAGLGVDRSGRELAARLSLKASTPPVDVAIRLHGGAPPFAAGMHWLLTSRGLWHKAVVVFRTIIPPRRFMLAWRPLARKGPSGLVLAYVWRVGWVVWHAGPAMRIVWRARRAERRSADETSPQPLSGS